MGNCAIWELTSHLLYILLCWKQRFACRILDWRSTVLLLLHQQVPGLYLCCSMMLYLWLCSAFVYGLANVANVSFLSVVCSGFRSLAIVLQTCSNRSCRSIVWWAQGLGVTLFLVRSRLVQFTARRKSIARICCIIRAISALSLCRRYLSNILPQVIELGVQIRFRTDQRSRLRLV